MPRTTLQFKLPDSQKAYFEFEKTLGAGSFGVTARLRVKEKIIVAGNIELPKGQLIVCKQMRAQHASDTFDYFYNEYKVAQRCAMRNICKMISFYEPPSPNVDKDYFLFMEYCDMGSMKDCIIKHKQALDPMPEIFLWHAFLSLARALRMMHFGTPPSSDPPKSWNAYLHCDIKPDNIMLKERPEYERIDFDFPVVKLCDFGASKRQGEKLIASTVNYDSPERWKDWDKAISTKNDIFALGVTMYHATELALPYKHTFPRPNWTRRKMLTFYQPWYMDLIRECMADEPSDRPDAAMLCDRIEQYRLEAMEAKPHYWGGKKLLT